MIEEADDVSQPLLDVILECVTSPKMKEQPQAYRSQPLLCMLHPDVFCSKEREEKTPPVGMKPMRSQVLYHAAQADVFCSLHAMMGCTPCPRSAPLVHIAVLYHAMLCCSVLYLAILC